MSEDEVYELIDRVRVYYQHLSRSDELNDEWYRILRNYNANEVNKNLDNYLHIERNRNRIPMPQDLTQGLLTIEQKSKKDKQNSGIIVNCNLCGRTMPLSEYDNKHFDRCSSINYLLRIMKEKGIKVEYEELDTLDEIKFQKVYEKYKIY